PATNACFPAFKMAAPTRIGDITQDGQVDSNDADAAAQLAAGNSVANVPARPATPATPIPGGPDPRLYIPTNIVGAVGQTVIVPVLLQVTDPAGVSVTGVDIALRYGASRFAISNLRPRDLLAGFQTAFDTQAPCRLRLVAAPG